MRLRHAAYLLGVVLGIVSPGTLWAQPKLSRESIPREASGEVRQQIEKMYSADPRERAAAIDRLGEMGQQAVPAIPFLIAILGDQGGLHTDVVEVDRVGGHVIRALQKIGAPAVDPLIGVLKEADPLVRRRTIDALGWIKDPRAAEPLIAALKDPEADVRVAAIYALGFVKDGRAVDALIAAMDDGDPRVRSSAARGLGGIGDRRGTKPLIAALKDSSEHVAWAAAFALSRIKDPAAFEPLLAALEDRRASVREEAATALGALKDPRAIDPLLAALKSSNRACYALALAAIGAPDARIGDAVLSSFKSADPHARQGIAAVLGQLKEPRAVEPLMAALGDPQWMVRYNAAYSLGQIGDLRAGDALRAALDDPQSDVRSRAAEALRMLRYRLWKNRQGHEIARGALIEAAGHDAIVKKGDGATVAIPVEQLSVEDRRYVDSEVSGKRARARWQSGEARAEADEMAQAEKRLVELTEAIRRNPDDVAAYLQRAPVWQRTSAENRKAKALADCREAMRINPSLPEAYYARGMVEMGDLPHLDRAVSDFKEALRRRPDYPQARRALAEAQGRRGIERLGYADARLDFAQAMAELDEAVRLDPACENVYWARGLVRVRSGRPDQAFAEFKEALRLNPRSEWALKLQGLESFKKGDSTKAVAELTEMIDLAPKHALNYAHRGRNFHLQGKYEKALTDYNRAVKSHPLLDVALAHRAWLRATCPDAKYRDAGLALSDAKDAVALSRDHDNLEALAAAQAEAGQLDEAAKSQQQALAFAEQEGDAVPPARRQDMQVRLQLYRERKPFREAPSPVVNGVITPSRDVPRQPASPPARPPHDPPARLVDIREERQNPDGTWVPVGADEVGWAGDIVRWSPRLEPDDFSQVASFRLLKRLPHELQAPWEEFARAGPGEKWALGGPGTGEWQITIEVRFANGSTLRGPGLAEERPAEPK